MEYSLVRKQIEQIAKTDDSDIDWLFCEVLKISRSQLSTNPKIDPKQHKLLIKIAKRLAKGMPLSVGLGKTEFYGLPFVVNKNVLTPRQETEELVDLVIKDIGDKQHQRVLDLCCGSGAIGITIAKNTAATVLCADISKHAIKKTRKNAKMNGCLVEIIKSDMLKNIYGNFDYIVCNPPYIEFGDERVEQRVHKFEPHLALYAANKGYYFYEYLAKQAKIFMTKGSKLCLEVGEGMAETVAKLFHEYSQTEIIKDMQGIDRMVIVTK